MNMQTTTVKFYTLGYTEAKTYLAASLFVLGNIALPQIFHPNRFQDREMAVRTIRSFPFSR